MKLMTLGAVAVAAVLLSSCNQQERTLVGPDDTLTRAAASDAITATPSTTAHGRGRTAPSSPQSEIEGNVKSVAAGSLVVTDARRGDVTVKVSASTIIRKGQTQIALSALVPGDRVHVRAEKNGDDLVASLVIVQTGNEDAAFEFSGRVKSISATSMTLTTGRSGEVTIAIASTTTFTPAPPAAGDHVEVRVQKSGDTLTAISVRVDAAGDDDGGDRATFELAGRVKSISSTALTVTGPRGDVTLVVNASTTFTPAAPQTGDRVEVRVLRSGDTLTAVSVHVESEQEREALELHGTVASISATAMTVTTPVGDVAVTINASTVFVPAAPQTGNRVEVRAQQQSGGLVALRVVVEDADDDSGHDAIAEAEGSVTSVSASAIVLQTRRGAVTVNIGAQTQIRRNGAPATAADIHTGDEAAARGTMVDNQTMNANQIDLRAEGESGGHH